MPKIQIVLGKPQSHSSSTTGNDSDILMKHLYANGIHYTTNYDTSEAKPIIELTYEEMFQRRVMIAQYREQKIPQSAIKNLVIRELDEYLEKSFKKLINSSGGQQEQKP